MSFYAAMLQLKGRQTVLVGGGRVAARKLAVLLEAGARVRLVAKRPCQDARDLADDPRVELLERAYQPGDLDGAWLVICATDDRALNQAVAAEAEARRVFVNVVDVPDLCSFIVPAIIRRGPLQVAVSTGGASPAAAAQLRRELESCLGPEWEAYLTLMSVIRQKVLAMGRPSEENGKLFKALAGAGLLPLLAARDWAGLQEKIAALAGPGFALPDLGFGPRGEGLA